MVSCICEEGERFPHKEEKSMSAVNSVHLIGNLSRDVKVINTQGKDGAPRQMGFITVAVSGYGRDKTDFIDVQVRFSGEAKVIPYLKKGQSIAVEGEIDTYKNKEGHTVMQVSCHQSGIRLLGGARNSQQKQQQYSGYPQNAHQGQGYDQQQYAPQQPQYGQQSQYSQQPQYENTFSDADFAADDSDIQF